MRLFNTISVEISSLCNRKCWFCPNATNKRPDEQMDIDLILKIAQELQSLNYDGRVELYIYNEPMRDRRLINIIHMFREYVPKCCIMIATNGDYVKSPSQFQELYDAGLNQLQVNIYSDKERYKQILYMLSTTDAVPGNVYLNQSPSKRLFSVEEKYGITQGSEKVGRFELNNRSGNVPALPRNINPIQKVCVRPFRYMQVNWKGEAILCCNDYHGEVVVGNVNTWKLEEIWFRSLVLNTYRKCLLQKNRIGLPLCEPCSFKGGAYTHLIAEQWPELVTNEIQKPKTSKLFGSK